MKYFFSIFFLCITNWSIAQPATTQNGRLLQVAEKQNIIERATVLKAKGVDLYQDGKMQDAVLAFRAAADLLENNAVEHPDLLANCLQKVALSYMKLEWYDLAEDYSFRSIEYARNLESPVSLVLDYATLGEIYNKQGRFEKALSYYDSCLQIDRKLNDTIYIAGDLSAIGLVNTLIGREQEGLNQLKEGLRLTTNTNSARTQCLTLNAMGLGYMNCKNFEKAEEYILASLALSQELRDTHLIINRYINLGELHVKTSKLDQAEKYLQKSLALLNDTFQPHRYTVIYRNLGTVYREKKQYKRAIEYFEIALEIAKEKDLLPNEQMIYQQLKDLYKSQGDYQKALSYADKFRLLSDSMFTISARERADIFNKKFALAEKEKAIQTLNYTNNLKQKDLQNLESQRKWLLATLLLSLLLGGVSFYAFRQRQANLLQKKEAKINQQLTEIQILRKEIVAALADNEQKVLAASLTFEEINQLLPEALSEREYEILQLVVQGKNNKEIATEVFLSVNTIKFHLKNIYLKLKVKNRMQVMQLALKK